MHSQLLLWLEQRRLNPCHRQLLIVCGKQSWATQTTLSILERSPDTSTIWVGNPPAEIANTSQTKQVLELDNTHVKDFQSKLGQETDFVVVDCYSGFRANAAIALSGTVKSHGLMMLICPPLLEWPKYTDPESINRTSHGFSTNKHSYFLEYLIELIEREPSVAIVTESTFKGEVFSLPVPLPKRSYHQQDSAIEAIKNVATGHRNRPLVITADRGRGKSSALGIAAADLIKNGKQKIIITAPHRKTVDHVFKHFEQNLITTAQDKTALNMVNKNQLQFESGSLVFIPVDRLLAEAQETDILLIDEAAALPINALTQLTQRYSRVVFSTTLHGYEGSGRGFDIRFKNQLKVLKPEFKTIHLNEPIRWYENDPLEQFWFSAFHYHTSTNRIAIEQQDSQPEVKLFSRQDLLSKNALTKDLFSLLIDAHYQTTPDDIQRFFDAPDSLCFIMLMNNQLVGVAQVLIEGGKMLTPLSEQIASCDRRVKGHLVAQNISSSYYEIDFAMSEQWRIARVAILPEFQNKGLGSLLIQNIVKEAENNNIDFVTSAFGSTSKLLSFWHALDFNIVKLSNKVEVSSGEHNGICIRAVNSQSSQILARIQTSFVQELLFQLENDWQNIDAEILINIIEYYAPAIHQIAINRFKTADLTVIEQFCGGNRPYSNCKRLVQGFTLFAIKHFSSLNAYEKSLLLTFVLQQHTVPHTCHLHELTGKKQLDNSLKSTLLTLLQHF